MKLFIFLNSLNMAIISQIVDEIIDKFIKNAKINDTTVNADELYGSDKFVKNMCEIKEKELFTYKLNKIYRHKLKLYEENEPNIRRTELFEILHNYDEFIKEYIKFSIPNNFEDPGDFIEYLNDIYEEKCEIYNRYTCCIDDIDYRDSYKFSQIFYEKIRENIPESVSEWITYILINRTDIKKIYIDCTWSTCDRGIIANIVDNNDEYIYDIIGKHIRKIKDVSTVKLRELLSRDTELQFEEEFYQDSYDKQYVKIIKYLYENLEK